MNVKRIMQDLGLKEDEVLEMMDIFIESGKSDLDMVEAALGENNIPDVARYAHSLKGAALNFGLDEITRKAQEMESEARSGALQGGFEAVALLRSMLQDVARTLR